MTNPAAGLSCDPFHVSIDDHPGRRLFSASGCAEKYKDGCYEQGLLQHGRWLRPEKRLLQPEENRRSRRVRRDRGFSVEEIQKSLTGIVSLS
ncbi:hypothetical protein [Acetobacter musti]|uniref:hypothetical protein n=1 Tax=Acetobacter musti TaxID=864732 RepID=UPI00156B7754|nr:hypothetical protein [Acetobacter musti]